MLGHEVYTNTMKKICLENYKQVQASIFDNIKQIYMSMPNLIYV